MYPPFISMPTRASVTSDKVLEVEVIQGTACLPFNCCRLVSVSRPMLVVHANKMGPSEWANTLKLAKYKLHVEPAEPETLAGESKQASAVLDGGHVPVLLSGGEALGYFARVLRGPQLAEGGPWPSCVASGKPAVTS
jgi:hypothetical protein